MVMDELKYKDGKFTVNGADMSSVSATSIITSAQTYNIISNEEYLNCLIDDNCKIISAIKPNGVTFIGSIESPTLDNINNKISSQKIYNSYEGVERIGIMPSPSLFDSDLCYIPMYGQSYSVANDGNYQITKASELSEHLYCHHISNAPVGKGITSLKKLKEVYGREYIINDIGQSLYSLINKRSGKKQDFLIATYGQGSRSIKELMKDNGYVGNKYHQYELVLEPGVLNAVSAATEANKTISCPCFVYLQGESDCRISRPVGSSDDPAADDSCCLGKRDEYKECFLTLKNQIQKTIMDATKQEIPPLAIIYACGNAVFKEYKSGIAEACIELSEENDDIYCIGPYYQTPSFGAHPTPDGNRWIGEEFAKTIYEVSIDGVDTLMCVKSCYVCDNSITLSIKTPTKPIIFDTWTVKQRNNYGFDVFVLDDYSASTISRHISITDVIAGNDTITLICAENIENNEDFNKIFIAYANQQVGGCGNVRDNGKWVSYNKYASNSLGDKTEITYIPLDKNGNELIGQRYPMQSWMPPFGFYLNEKLITN